MVWWSAPELGRYAPLCESRRLMSAQAAWIVVLALMVAWVGLLRRQDSETARVSDALGPAIARLRSGATRIRCHEAAPEAVAPSPVVTPVMAAVAPSIVVPEASKPRAVGGAPRLKPAGRASVEATASHLLRTVIRKRCAAKLGKWRSKQVVIRHQVNELHKYVFGVEVVSPRGSAIERCVVDVLEDQIISGWRWTGAKGPAASFNYEVRAGKKG